MTSPLLEVRDCDAFYDDSHVLHAVSLRVAAATGVALLGRNGAGKSTLMKSILGAGPTVRGEILLEGRSIARTPAYLRAGMGLSLVPEDRRIFPHVTVAENLAMARRAARQGVEALTPAEAAALFPMLEGLLDRKGYQLSGGQQQILAVARGLVPRPQLLLLDEPTEGLAPIIVQDMAAQMTKVRAQSGAALLLAEQNVSFARHCTESVFVIDSGRIVFEGSWTDFDANRARLERFLAV
ncbi:MAG: ABC transporter ATP-binding protein [Rhizobiaceae bacterium]|nr:ABC transporter ATP-binding protein [Rhizobiaceae bacterium]